MSNAPKWSNGGVFNQLDAKDSLQNYNYGNGNGIELCFHGDNTGYLDPIQAGKAIADGNITLTNRLVNNVNRANKDNSYLVGLMGKQDALIIEQREQLAKQAKLIEQLIERLGLVEVVQEGMLTKSKGGRL